MNEQTKSAALDDNESRWLRETYKPGVPQLTARAVLAGMAIGVLMCLSNLYVFFKTGWSTGVTITAGILAFALFRGLESLRLTRKPLTALENNALTTVASGAGYMTGGGNMAAYGALLMLITAQATTLGVGAIERPGTLPMVFWFAAIAALGVFAAIPIKRQLINKEALVFPTGTATAETLNTIHGAGAGASNEGSLKARALAFAAVIAGVLVWMRDAKAAWMPFNLPGAVTVPLTIAGRKAAEWTLALKTELILVGFGALMSFRTAWSLLLGGLLTYGYLAPRLLERGLIQVNDAGEISYKAIVNWTVWPAAAILVASGLTSFALDWRSVARSFSGLGRIFGRRAAVADPMDEIECPGWWFPAGFIVLSPVVVALAAWLFQIPLWAGAIAVPLALVMGFVAARVTGDTDITPTKALGPVTQLFYGVITPGNVPGNIMSANITGGIGLHAADLLTTLKTGWLLGGNPRVQFWAQLIGVAVGAAVIVPAFDQVIPDPSMLGSEEWPAPSCVVWSNVSKAFANGVGSLDSTAQLAILVGLALGVALALLEKFAPKRAKPYVPSPSGLGIAMVIPGSNAIAMFLGALVAELLRRRPTLAARLTVPVASGFIAGESLIGIVVQLLKARGVLNK